LICKNGESFWGIWTLNLAPEKFVHNDKYGLSGISDFRDVRFVNLRGLLLKNPDLLFQSLNTCLPDGFGRLAESRSG
jgi:hypothetical protein